MTCSQSMVQGRLQYADRDIPVQVGGGDGVIVVPRRFAYAVAKYARREYDNDKAARRRMYAASGLELDDSVK